MSHKKDLRDLRKHYIKEMFAGRLKYLQTDGIWVNGFQGEGEYKQWHDNGQLELCCHYKDGELNGELKRWYANGNPAIHCYFKKDRIDGEYKTWLHNGQLTVVVYKKGKIVEAIIRKIK